EAPPARLASKRPARHRAWTAWPRTPEWMAMAAGVLVGCGLIGPGGLATGAPRLGRAWAGGALKRVLRPKRNRAVLLLTCEKPGSKLIGIGGPSSRRSTSKTAPSEPM